MQVDMNTICRYSPAMDAIATEFHASRELVIVGLSVCLLQ